MAFHRPLLLASLVALIPLSACGGSDTIVPEGTHYHYVANKALVPTNNNESREYGLDLNGDGTVDNQLGMVLGTLAGMGFDIQATIDKAVLGGSIILLADVQTKDFASTAAAGVQVFLGTNPQPPACNAAEEVVCDTAKPAVCTGCGHHLTPAGAMFSIDPNSPNDAALAGKIIGGTFTGGPGNLSLQIALGGSDAIQLDLIGARAKASGITADGIGTLTGSTVTGGIVFAGAISKDDIDTKVIPAVQTQLGPTIAKDCPTPTVAGCGCTDGSTGKTILGLFDTNHDCVVSVDEIKSNSLIMSLLAPDVTVDGKMALSLGIKAVAEKAVFTVPGQM
jgi:hypothetical protein